MAACINPCTMQALEVRSISLLRTRRTFKTTATTYFLTYSWGLRSETALGVSKMGGALDLQLGVSTSEAGTCEEATCYLSPAEDSKPRIQFSDPPHYCLNESTIGYMPHSSPFLVSSLAIKCCGEMGHWCRPAPQFHFSSHASVQAQISTEPYTRRPRLYVLSAHNIIELRKTPRTRL